MPDYGLRPPPYFSGNMPRGILGNSPYGWVGTPSYDPANTPTGGLFSDPNQFVYERLDWAKFKQQVLGPGGPNVTSANPSYWSNPPFLGAGQMLGPNGAPSWMRGPDGGTQRILRGYLRRQRVSATEPESFVRLYFMYNPDQVQRQYLSWSEDQTADPTGSLGQDASFAPTGTPSLTTLSFTLYFDRQLELMQIEDHPGVMVDLQTFDVLSGNLVYKTATGEDVIVPVLPPGMALPDNTDVTDNRSGQYVPRVSNVNTTVTAVFSPSLAVEGVLSGANATFTKFSSRMTPATLALNITLMVQYVGKNNNQSLLDQDMGAGVQTNPQVYNPAAEGFIAPATQTARNTQTKAGAEAAVTWASLKLMDTMTGDPGNNHYDITKRDQGIPCQITGTNFTDAASFVWRSFHVVGWAGTDLPGGDLLGLGGTCYGGSPTSDAFLANIRKQSTGTGRKWQVYYDEEHPNPPDKDKRDDLVELMKRLRKGDVLVRRAGFSQSTGHVAFVNGTSGDLTVDNWDKKVIQLLHSPNTDSKDSGGNAYQLGGSILDVSMNDVYTTYSLWARPEPWGPTTDGYGALGGTQPVVPGGGSDPGKDNPPGTLTLAQTVEVDTGKGKIRLSPTAAPYFEAWKNEWGSAIPCTSGWRSYEDQKKAYDDSVAAGDPNRFAPADKSWHCKGLAVDVDNGWLNGLSALNRNSLRAAAADTGWGQARWRQVGGPTPGYESPCHNSTPYSSDTSEPWHFSWGGCG